MAHDGRQKLGLCMASRAQQDLYFQSDRPAQKLVHRILAKLHSHTDSGPQFRSEVQDFCKSYNSKHELDGAHNPKSNGLVKAAVKNMKSLVTRTHDAKENLVEAVAAWRNMARSDGKSPSQIFFGRSEMNPTILARLFVWIVLILS